MFDEADAVDIVEDVASELRDKANQYDANKNMVFEDKAIYLAEIKAALTCLSAIKKSPKAVAVTNKINTCMYNQQLIYLAMKSIKQNDELKLQYQDLQNICHYKIDELKY